MIQINSFALRPVKPSLEGGILLQGPLRIECKEGVVSNSEDEFSSCFKRHISKDNVYFQFQYEI